MPTVEEFARNLGAKIKPQRHSFIATFDGPQRHSNESALMVELDRRGYWWKQWAEGIEYALSEPESFPKFIQVYWRAFRPLGNCRCIVVPVGGKANA